MPRESKLTALKRIAITLNAAWNIYHYRSELVRALLNNGYDVIAIAPKDGYEDEVVKLGCRFIPITCLYPTGRNPVEDVKYIKELSSQYRKNKVDLALQFTIKPNIYGSLAAGFSKVKTVSTLTGLGYSFLTDGWTNFITKKLYKLALSKNSLVVFQNRHDRDLFINSGLVNPSKVRLIEGSGINTVHFNPVKTVPGKNGQFCFLFVGRLLKEKGIRELMAAIDRISPVTEDIHFGIIGSPDTQNPASINAAHFQSWLQKKTNVWYLDHTEDIRSHISSADSIILPSYREGMARILLESMSMEKPLITTNVPGCQDAVTDGINGLIAEVRDVDSLVSAILKMRRLSVEERLKMGKSGREIAKSRFDIQIVVQKYLDLIKEVLEI